MLCTWKKMFMLLAIVMATSGCHKVAVKHSPLIAKASESVTFTANALTGAPFEVKIWVNGAVVQTCTTNPCTFTGGPYPAYEDSTVSYKATVKILGGCQLFCTDTDGWNYFAITDSNYNWSSPYIPARKTGSTSDKEDLVFHMASDYAANSQTFGTFVSHVRNKIFDVFGAQDIVEHHLEDFNFWVYKKEATAAGCGTVHSDSNTDMPWRDDDAVLHWENFQDCTNPGLTHYSAEGSNTKAFLHESGHSVFGLADEYCGNTGYFEAADEPNIWDVNASCEAEQTAKGRDPAACQQFCANSGGWHGIQTGTTVMTQGMVGDPWYTEAAERVRWFFSNL